MKCSHCEETSRSTDDQAIYTNNQTNERQLLLQIQTEIDWLAENMRKQVDLAMHESELGLIKVMDGFKSLAQANRSRIDLATRVLDGLKHSDCRENANCKNCSPPSVESVNLNSAVMQSHDSQSELCTALLDQSTEIERTMSHLVGVFQYHDINRQRLEAVLLPLVKLKLLLHRALPSDARLPVTWDPSQNASRHSTSHLADSATVVSNLREEKLGAITLF